MADSSKITISADGHYRSTGELQPEKPFDLSDANASNTPSKNYVIHRSIERDFVNDEKGQAGVQAPKTDSKGKATDHGESQVAGRTGENTAAEAGGEKSKKKRSRRRKPKKSNATTQQEDETPSSPVSPAWVQDVPRDDPTSSRKGALDTNTNPSSTTPVTVSKPSGHVPTSDFTYSSGVPTSATPQTSTDNTKPPRLFSIAVAPPRDPKIDEWLRGELPPAKSPFPYGPHGWMNIGSTSNDGFKVMPPESTPSATSTSLPTDQPPAETSVPLQVQQRKIHRIRRLENRKANAGDAEPAASNVWDTEKAETNRQDKQQVPGPNHDEGLKAIPHDTLLQRYLALYNKCSDVEEKNLKLEADNYSLTETVLKWDLLSEGDKTIYEALLQSHRKLKAQVTALKGQQENSNDPGAETDFKGNGTAEENEDVEDPKNVQKDIKDLNGSAVNLAERVKESDKKVGERGLEIETLKQKNIRLENDVRDERKKNEDSETSRKLMNEDVDRLKQDCETFEQKLKESEEKLKESDEKLKESEEKLKESDEKLQESDEKLNSSEKKIDGLNTTVEIRDAEILQNEKTINKYQADNQKLQDSQHKYEEEFEGYRKELKDCKDKHKAAQAECKRLEGVIKGQVAHIGDQDTENSNLKKGIKVQGGLEATIKDLKGRIKDLKGQIKDLETELQQSRTLPSGTEPRDPDHSSEAMQELIAEQQKQIQDLQNEQTGNSFDTKHLEEECTLHERALRLLEEDVEDLRTQCGSLERASKDYLGQIDKMKVAVEGVADANPGPSNTSPAASQAGNDLEGIPDQSHPDPQSDEDDPESDEDDPESDEDDHASSSSFRMDEFSDSGNQPSFRSRQARRAHGRPGSLSDGVFPLSLHRVAKGPQQAMTSAGTQTDAEATTTTDHKPGPMGLGPITTDDIEPMESIEVAPPTTTVIPIKRTGRKFSWRWWCCLALLFLVVVAWLAAPCFWGGSARRELDMWAEANRHVSRQSLSFLRGGDRPGGMGWLWGGEAVEYGNYY
ncbi:MAG: hypothetical protein L6R37_003482 [Teloschistes peruensis]|nr:MAG: hypothetical protein L6R37_003482 [Teloschistes peruensis]